MYKLLSIDGGGGRAFIALQALKYLELKTGKHCVELFDRIVGTSTGAIIALALTKSQPLYAWEIEQFYDRTLPAVFKRRILSYLSFGLTGAKYDAAVLETALRHVFGDEPIGPKAIAYTVDTSLAQATVLRAHAGWKAWEVARASSSAPTYFAPFVRDGIAYWDGGLVCNNPANDALEISTKTPEDALVLSLGTGIGKEGWAADKVTHWSTIENLPALMTIMMDANSELAHWTLMQLLPAAQYLRLQCELADASMDNASSGNIAVLKNAGAKLVARNQAALDAFILKLTEAK